LPAIHEDDDDDDDDDNSVDADEHGDERRKDDRDRESGDLWVALGWPEIPVSR